MATIYKDVGAGGFNTLYPADTDSQIAGFSYTGVTAEISMKGNSTLTYVDSPSSTDELTYTLYIGYANGTNFNIAPAGNECSITLIEFDGS